jgi:hypothetical protein
LRPAGRGHDEELKVSPLPPSLHRREHPGRTWQSSQRYGPFAESDESACQPASVSTGGACDESAWTMSSDWARPSLPTSSGVLCPSRDEETNGPLLSLSPSLSCSPRSTGFLGQQIGEDVLEAWQATNASTRAYLTGWDGMSLTAPAQAQIPNGQAGRSSTDSGDRRAGGGDGRLREGKWNKHSTA